VKVMPKESMYFKIENLNGKHDMKQKKTTA
jgi:hypothetical protein